MSDPYSTIITGLIDERRAAAMHAVSRANSSPDDAVRALQLSQATGVPAPVIAGDLESFETQTKQQMVGDFVRGNSHIAAYMASHPLAADVSNDDLGNLDTVSQKLEPASGPGALSKIVEAFNHGMGEGGLGKWAYDPNIDYSNPLNRLGWAAWSMLGAPIEIPMRLFGAFTHAAAAAVGESYKAAGGSEAWANRLTRDVIQATEANLSGNMLLRGPMAGEFNAIAKQAQRATQTAAPYVRAGREPPIGIDPLWDEAKIAQSEADLKTLMDALKESQKSATRERSPEMFADFARQQVGEESIGIHADAIRALYGDKLPEPGDGKLGFVPRLMEKVEAAEATGGYVDVSKADWLAHIEPDVAKALEDFTRPRPNGLSKAEADFVKASMPKEETLPAAKPSEAVREAAGLEKKETGFTLQREQGEIAKKSFDDLGRVGYSIVDSAGKEAGYVVLGVEKDGRRLYIDDIEAGVNTIGPRAIRDLLRQLKEEWPQAEELAGFRVSGARGKALTFMDKGDVAIKLAEPTASDKLFQMLLDDRIEELGEVTDLGTGWEITTLPEDRQLNFERGILKAVDKEIEKLQAFDVDVEGVHRIKHIDSQGLVRGLYQSFEAARPSILFALTADDPVGVFRHEVIHDLRQRGFLSEAEWTTLEQAAMEGKWLEKYQIEARYKDQKLDLEGSLEEAIADEFADWRRQGRPDSAVGRIFAKIEQLVEAIRAAMRRLFGTENWKDIFDKIESGEVYQREPGAEFGDVTKLSKDQPELPHTRRMEDRDVFAEAQAIGMTVDQYKRYMKLIAERHRQDLEIEAKRALEEQRKKQTAQWKENYKETRDVVADEVNARPDVATDNLLRDGRLYGDKVEPVKLGTEYLTDEQRAALPKDYVAAKGAHPDDIAALTGYPSGQALVTGMVQFNEARKAAGMRPVDYTRRLIDAETDRQMEAKYGKLGDTILQEAKEQVLSETQLDLLHEEVLAMGLKAGAEFSITKAQMKEWVAERFKALDAKDVSSDKFLADAGRAGRAAEDALLRADPAEAFRQKQRQYLAVAMSRQAKDFEDAKQSFAKTAERMTRKENKAVDKDFMNFAQAMLAKGGYNIKRNLNELTDSIDRSGYSSFDEFVSSKVGDGWELTISDAIRNGREKPIEQMTTEEFMELKDALDQLYHVGRAVKKIEVAGQKIDFEEFKKSVLEKIRTLPVRDKDNPVRRLFRYDASMVRMEEIAKDLDLREEAGPLWSALIRPMIDAKHTEYSMLEDLSKKLKELKGDKKWVRSMDETIPQDFFIDPYDGTVFDLTRQHMIQIMLNFGNRSNIDKFTRGYVGKDEAVLFEQKLWQMIHQHATKADWEYVQNIWDIFDGWKKQSAELYYDLSGRQPKWVEPQEVVTPHGNFRGGYYPIIYDRLRSNINAVEEKVSPNAMFGPNYFRASPANHYTKERTGYADRIQFQTSLEQVAGRMQQLIHDIAYRRPVMDASKIVYDREIRGAIRKHYGMEYERQLDPWLKDIANHFNNDEVANEFGAAVMRRARVNLMGHALGLNLKVILSPSVAKMNPADAMRVWTNYAASEKLAYEKSREIPHTFRNIDRDFRERLEQSISSGGWDATQAAAVRWAFLPVVKVEQQFRIITFVNEYEKALGKGFSDGEAASLADSAVRERHGSSGLPDMPAIMRSGEGMKIATMFYGYFSAMYNWQRQIPGNLRRGEWMKGMENIWGAIVVPALFGAVLFNQSKEGDSWSKTIAKALVLQPLSTLVFVRDFANFFLEGNPSRTPLATLAAGLSSAVTDVKRKMEGKRIDKPIQHAGNVIGLSTGLPLAQPSRTAQFLYDVNTGKQRPRNILEWSRGIITGEARLKK